jgi:type I restriction enzyme R subunit
MSYNEADTRAKLIDPAIHKRGWTEDLIRREETAGAIEIVGGKDWRLAQAGLFVYHRDKLRVRKLGMVGNLIP